MACGDSLQCLPPGISFDQRIGKKSLQKRTREKDAALRIVTIVQPLNCLEPILLQDSKHIRVQIIINGYHSTLRIFFPFWQYNFVKFYSTILFLKKKLDHASNPPSLPPSAPVLKDPSSSRLISHTKNKHITHINTYSPAHKTEYLALKTEGWVDEIPLGLTGSFFRVFNPTSNFQDCTLVEGKNRN